MKIRLLPQRFVRSLPSRSLIVSGLVSLAITLVPQGVWSVLIALNLRSTPEYPWAVGVTACLLALLLLYLNGSYGPSHTAGSRHSALRLNPLSGRVLLWSIVAGSVAIVALDALWKLLASIVKMPGSVLPNLSTYPRWTALLAIGMAALISPVCEQAGIWGYWQSALRQRYSPRIAIIVSATTFALLPHPSIPAAFWAKFLFFLFTGLTFSTLAYLTDSIVAGIAIQSVAILWFMLFEWPHDPARPLIAETRPSAQFYAAIAQLVIFAACSAWAFSRLRRLAGSAAV